MPESVRLCFLNFYGEAFNSEATAEMSRILLLEEMIET